ncbi:MAG: peptide ABC transporter substrate-binding protein [Chlamydiia bacterium]|nr:peptide ABC transporter substrate-binding protein [Chlamydiia bacterium]
MHFRICLLIFLSLFFFAGCENQPSQSLKADKIKLNLGTEPPTLDPRVAIDSTSINALLFLFEGLTRLSHEGQPKLALAKEVSISKDLLTYTFKLREAFWSNGERVTSADFVKGFQTTLDPLFPSPAAYKLYIVKNGRAIKKGLLPNNSLGVETPDSKTLIIHLEHPATYFLELVACPIFFPIHQKGDFERDFITNGPYIIEKWEHEHEICLKKNPLYWDSKHVRIQNVDLMMIDDSLTEYYLFENGELDFAGAPYTNLAVDVLPSILQEGKLNQYPFSAVYCYKVNTHHSHLSNQKIRKGLSYLINREAIVEHVMQVGHTPASGYIPPLPDPVFQRKIFLPNIPSSIGKDLFFNGLVEEGYTPETFPPVTISYNANKEHQRVAQAIGQAWQDTLGIKVFLEQYDWKTYLSKMNQMNYEIARVAWVGEYLDPLAFLETFQSNNDNNLTGFSDDIYDQLVDWAKKERDPFKRAEILSEAEAKLLDQMPIIPIYFIDCLYLIHPRLKNVVLTSLGTADFTRAYFE